MVCLTVQGPPSKKKIAHDKPQPAVFTGRGKKAAMLSKAIANEKESELMAQYKNMDSKAFNAEYKTAKREYHAAKGSTTDAEELSRLKHRCIEMKEVFELKKKEDDMKQKM